MPHERRDALARLRRFRADAHATPPAILAILHRTPPRSSTVHLRPRPLDGLAIQSRNRLQPGAGIRR